MERMQVFAPAVFLSLAITAFSQDQGKPFSIGESSGVQIGNLIRQLGDKDFRVREAAMKNLDKIGEPALEALREAIHDDAEAQRRANRLINGIERRLLITRVNGMEFKLIADSEWPSLKSGDEKKIRFGLKVTNISDSVRRIYIGCFHVVLIVSTGEKLLCKGGTYRSMNALESSPPLAKNQSFAMLLEARVKSSDGKIQLACEDTFSNFWIYEGLGEGNYYLAIGYDTRRLANSPKYADSRIPFWLGKVQTRFQTVEIK
jgi:hypothetical protein